MEEVISNGERKEEVKLLHSPEDIVPRNKSPVQQWVDSLPLEETVEKVEEPAVPVEQPPPEQEAADAEVEGFTLGAEAVGVTCPRPYPFVHVTNTCGGSDAGSHCSSMESLLESRKPDPEEILLELGFGGVEESDTVSRIPARFLQPSALKGVAIEEFLKHQQLLVDTYESGFSGYRGLAGPFNTIPSGIVGKIMERLREAEVGRNNNQHHRHAHAYHNHKFNQSVLSPDNRKWLERQGVSPEPEGRRIVLGEKTFTFAKDGVLIEGSYEKNGLKVDMAQKTQDKDKGVKVKMAMKSKDNQGTEKTGGPKLAEKLAANGQTTSNIHHKLFSLDNEQLEMEYKTLALLANQLQGSDIPIDFVPEDTFYKLSSHERKRVERGLVENALYTYQRRLKDLDLRDHLKEFLSTQADKVSSNLGRRDPEWINIIRQMTTLLRHQETLRQTLRFTRNGHDEISWMEEMEGLSIATVECRSAL
ncbi:unnamed protein product [Nezara viridula]|uniref:ITPR-interacting domain-containing protein n=1 Tax=Nezara viridula TaxID=85310 RepID=A0A9P0MKR5_NEZVI|nr:unnamed protein product [Nezara viridula]